MQTYLAASNLSSRRTLTICLLPLVAFAAAAAPLAGWIIDDAGISFAYARNFANGAGLVSQPGKPPVEGFSNPLWTLLFVPGFWFGSHLPLFSAKLFGHLFALGVFLFGFRIVVRVTGSQMFGALAMLFLAVNTSFVVWSVSGLENALYAFEVAGLTYLALRCLDDINWRIAVWAGLLTAAAALTRPDGILFAMVWPWALFIVVIRDRRISSATVQAIVAFVLAAALPFFAYKAAAFAYFGDLLPNTYYAKGAPGLSETLIGLLNFESPFVLRSIDILSAPFGVLWLGVGVFIAAVIMVAVSRRLSAQLIFLIGASGLGFLNYVLLPTDWMAEFRFGTPFLVIFYPTLFSLICIAGQAIPRSRITSEKFPALFAVALLAVATILNHQIRFERFYQQPTAPFSTIAEQFGERFNTAAEIMGIENGSFLLPDLGATLFYSDLEIYDLAGLTDARIARTLWTDKDALRAYIFDEVKPTLILTYQYSALEADLDSSQSFRTDYVPIFEEIDDVASKEAGRTIYSGSYVRKDAIASQPQTLVKARDFLYGAAPQ